MPGGATMVEGAVAAAQLDTALRSRFRGGKPYLYPLVPGGRVQPHEGNLVQQPSLGHSQPPEAAVAVRAIRPMRGLREDRGGVRRKDTPAVERATSAGPRPHRGLHFSAVPEGEPHQETCSTEVAAVAEQRASD